MVGSLRWHAGASRRAAFGSHYPYHIGNPMPRESHGRGWQMPDVPLPSKVEQLLHSLHCASELLRNLFIAGGHAVEFIDKRLQLGDKLFFFGVQGRRFLYPWRTNFRVPLRIGTRPVRVFGIVALYRGGVLPQLRRYRLAFLVNLIEP